jgi:very-short-patch-repair endonuclease
MLEPSGRYPDVVAHTDKRRDGINTHRAATFERTTHKGIPVTTPIQTLIHLSAIAEFKTLRRAVNEALNRRLITPLQLLTANHRGAKKLRGVLATAAPTRSETEYAVLHLLNEAGIAKPLVNPPVAGTNLIPDFLWPHRDLILEADSETYHNHMLARADDRTKQAVFEGLGYTVIRTSWAEITSRPDRMISRVRAG